MSDQTTQAGRTVRLVMVTPENHNKFYEMAELPDGSFQVQYGRVGAAPAVKRYPIAYWEAKYREKVRKGYRDVSHLLARQGSEPVLAIGDPGVCGLIQTLMQYARRSTYANYMVTAEQVTPQQIRTAQALLDELFALVERGAAPETLNARLLELYTVIPRKMARVDDHLIGGLETEGERDRVEAMLAGEQTVLEAMAGQVKLFEQVQASGGEAAPQSLLERMGLALEPVADGPHCERIREMMGTEAGTFRRAYAVTNRRTEQAFAAAVGRSKNGRTALLWHGSRNENWLSILESGLVLRPANAVITGKMFGYGLYFADQCRKSINYTSLRGSYWTGGRDDRAFLALYDVHLGEALHIRKHYPWCTNLTEADLRKRRGLLRKRYDSVFAEGGADLRNNEYIIYNEAQCTIRYLVEVSR